MGDRMIRILESCDEVYPKEYTETRRHTVGNDISQDDALTAVTVALQLCRHRSCSVSNDALWTATSVNCPPDNLELENTSQYLATQLIYSKAL